jgi:uncharacterized membrane protein
MNPYTILKFIHVFMAIVAVGFNISYSVWIPRAARDPEHFKFVLQGVHVLDSRFANPGYALLLLTGLGMLYFGSIPLTTFWIAAALVLYVAAIVVGIALFAPVFRRQIAALDAGGPASPEFVRLSRQSTMLGMLTAIIIVLILVLMVFKPML